MFPYFQPLKMLRLVSRQASAMLRSSTQSFSTGATAGGLSDDVRQRIDGIVKKDDVVVFMKGTFLDWVAIVTRMEDTNDTITRFGHHIWNAIDIFRTFTTTLFTSRFGPDSATLFSVLTTAFSRISFLNYGITKKSL